MNRPEPSTLDRRLAPWMFWGAVLYLVCMAGALHLTTDEDPVAADASASTATALISPPRAANAEAAALSAGVRQVCGWGMLVLAPLFFCEAFWHWREGSISARHLWYCVLPALRIGGRDFATGRLMWLPGVGWAEVDAALRRRVERGSNVPMLIIALLVLPLLAVEHFFEQQINQSSGLLLAAKVSAALIWLAFTFEFIVLIALAEQKWRYARQHWLDLVIITLPLCAFLRAGRLLRLTRLSRTSRVFRLRGTATRGWRALLLLKVVERMIAGRPEKQIAGLRAQVEAKERELAELRSALAEAERKLPATSSLGDISAA